MANKQPPASKSITDCFSALPQPSGSGINNLQNQPSKKRQREDLENTPDIPSILLSTADGNSLLPNDSSNQNSIQAGDGNSLLPNDSSNQNSIQAGNNLEKTAVHLDRLYDKKARYESHIDFLSKCINNKIIPHGLQMELEPTIGNHDDEFVSNWYEKLNLFSIEMMKDIVAFCKKTTSQIEPKIQEINTRLKDSLPSTDFQKVKLTLEKNDERNKINLNHRKRKKFTQLKYYPNRINETKTKHENSTTYQKTPLKNAPIKKQTSNTNITQNHPNQTKNPWFNNKRSNTNLRVSRSNNNLQSKVSSTNIEPRNDAQQLKINELQAELNSLRNEQRKGTKNGTGLPKEAQQHQQAVKTSTTSPTHGDILQLINQTMETLQKYAKQFAKPSDTPQTLLGM